MRSHTMPEAASPVTGETAEETADRRMREAVENPTIVQWYCYLKLELMLHLARKVLDAVHPEDGGNHDDYWATFEWGAGGITHIPIIMWKERSVRIEQVVRPDACGRTPAAQDDAVLETEAVNRLQEFALPQISEVNASKRHPPEGRSLAAEVGEGRKQRLRKRAKDLEPRPEVPHPSCIDWEGFAHVLHEANSADAEAAFDRRLELVAQLADFCNMHDWHTPFAGGKPDKSDTCAKCTRVTKGTSNEIYECRANFPRTHLIPPGEAHVKEDEQRPGV